MDVTDREIENALLERFRSYLKNKKYTKVDKVCEKYKEDIL
jgi:hypothetical protein